MAFIRNRLNKFIARMTAPDLQELWDIKVHILDKKTKQPIGGESYMLELYDEDKKDVDFLGSGPLNEQGIADIRFNPQDINQGEEDSILPETKPDIFFVIKKDGKEVYRSTTTYDIDFEKHATFDIEDGKEVFLGTFLIHLED